MERVRGQRRKRDKKAARRLPGPGRVRAARACGSNGGKLAVDGMAIQDMIAGIEQNHHVHVIFQ